ncbi:MAG: hypothetical protein AAF202_12895, partial [Pseudomonadota bacterium]
VLVFIVPPTHADNKRSVSLEWSAVPDASGYEIRLIRKNADGSKEKPIRYNVADPKWEAIVNYGKYDLQLRSYDDRNVPGDWSAPMEFVVKPLIPVAISPIKGKKVQSSDDEESVVKLSWKETEGADKYSVRVTSLDGSFSENALTSSTSAAFELPVARQYSWTVQAIMKDGTEGETHTQRKETRQT